MWINSVRLNGLPFCSIRKIVKLFNCGSVQVSGCKGTGKDTLFGNVIMRQKKPYISNLNYGGTFYPFVYKDLNLSENSFENIVSGNVKHYLFPYPDGTDVFISDAGVYFPSQYCGLLNKKFESFPYFMALSRQLGNCNVHVNTQHIGRCWDKIREQSDIYIRCNFCKVIGKRDSHGVVKHGLVIMKITIYDKYEACLNRVKPCRVKIPLFANREMRLRYQMHIDKFQENNGNVVSKILIFKNKSLHDSYYFKSVFENGF